MNDLMRRSHDEPVKLAKRAPDAPGLEAITRVRFLSTEATGTHNADRQTKIWLDQAHNAVVLERFTADADAKLVSRKRYPLTNVAFYMLEGDPGA